MKLTSASATDGDDQISTELAEIRDALEDLRRRPAPVDTETLRHIVAASLAEASTPPPNLLVTAIRRLDRLDARLESIEAALGGSGVLPPAAGNNRRRAPSSVVESSVPTGFGSPDAEAIADTVTRRLTEILSGQGPVGAGGAGASFDDLIATVRPLLHGAARTVLRRSGGEPSAQAVEVLQRTALAALEAAVDSVGLYAGPIAEFAPLAAPQPSAAPTASLPARAEPRPPTPPPLDLNELASEVAAHVADILSTRPGPLTGTVEKASLGRVVGDAVLSHLRLQPAPTATISPVAMVPLLSAVANVESAVAQLALPSNDVVAAIDRLEAGVGALVDALEQDRSRQADEVERSVHQGQRMERSVHHVLTALAALADHLQEQRPLFVAESPIEDSATPETESLSEPEPEPDRDPEPEPEPEPLVVSEPELGVVAATPETAGGRVRPRRRRRVRRSR